MKTKKLLAVLVTVLMVLGMTNLAVTAAALPTGAEIGTITVRKANAPAEDAGETFNTFAAAFAEINADEAYNGATLVCEAEKLIPNGGNHITIQRSVTIEGNGATLVCTATGDGQADFAIEMYGDLVGHTTIVINNLKNAAVWGTRTTNYDLYVTLNNCDSNIDIENSSQRVYMTGGADKGKNYITIKNCDFASPTAGPCAVYSNHAGSVTVEDCSFTNISEPINLNNKSAGTQTVTVSGTTFTDCGLGTSSDATWAAPIRVLCANAAGTSDLSVDACTFTYSEGKASCNGDILLGDGREGKESYPVQASVTGTDAEIQVQVPGDRTAEANNASQKITASSTGGTPVAIDTTVATIGEGDEQKKFASLASALAGAEEEDTITLLAGEYSAAPLVMATGINPYPYADKIKLLGQGDVSLKLTSAEKSYQNGAAYQYMIAGGWYVSTEALAFENIDFVFTDTNTEDTQTMAELQVYTTKSLSFKGCTFDNVSVNPWGDNGTKECGTAIFDHCEFKNIGSRSAIHQSRAAELTVTESDFISCNSGIHISGATLDEVNITNNTFTGTTSCVVTLANDNGGDYSATVFNITGNKAEGQTMLRQLNPTVPVSAIDAILDTENNTYGTDYLDSSLVYVAKVNDTGFTTLRAALEAADLVENSTVQLFPGTFILGEEEFPASVTDVTIKGAENKATILKNSSLQNDALPGTWSDPAYASKYHNITIDGIVFDNSFIKFTGWANNALNQSVSYKDWTITNCEFKNVENEAAVYFNLGTTEAMENVTFTNNVIDGVLTTDKSGFGINAVAGNITISKNTIKNVDFNSIQIQNAPDTATVTITENVLNSNKQLVNMYYILGESTVKKNVFIAPSESVYYFTHVSTKVDLSENFFGIGTDVADAVFNENFEDGIHLRNDEGAKGDTYITSHYADAALENLVITAEAKVGDKYYETLSEALVVADALENGTVQLTAGTFTLGDVKFPASLTDVTIKGAENKTTIIKDSTLRSADGNAVTYSGITFDGIVFDNSNIVFTGKRNGDEVYRDWTITNCEFRNIVRDGNLSALHFNNSSGAEAMTNFTFTNNVIDGVSGSSNSGINTSAMAGTVVITGNTFSNVATNALQLKGADETATLTVSGNTVNGIGSSIFNLYNFAGTKTFAENTVTKSGAEQKIFSNISGGITLGEGNTWLDEEGNPIENPGFEAAIGNVYYVTVEDAMLAAGAEDTVTLLTDLEITEATNWDADVDANENTITISDGGSLSGATTVSNGTIEVGARTEETAALGGISLTDMTLTATEGGNIFSLGAEETAVWENVNATITGADTGLAIAAGSSLSVTGNSVVIVTDSATADLTIGGELIIDDTVNLVAPDTDEEEGAQVGGAVLNGIVVTPVISPDGGSYKGKVLVTITSETEGASIYYTTNGTAPTAESTLYTGTFVLGEGDHTVKAIAIAENMMDSEVASAEFAVAKKANCKSTSITTPAAGTTEKDPTEDTEDPETPGEKEEPGESTEVRLSFADVADDFWGYEGIAYCYENGIMNGMSETTFEPETTLTRAMVITMLYRLAGEPEAEAEGDEWYAKAVAWAIENGISDGSSVEASITREQLVTMLYRYAGAKAADESVLVGFTDANSISTYAVEAMNWAVSGGIITGMGDGTAAPQGTATRAQVATIFMRYMEMLAA